MKPSWHAELVQELVRQYRVEQPVAEQYLDEQLASIHPLSQFMREHLHDTDLLRRSEFKQFKKKLKKELYFTLRTYSLSDSSQSLVKQLEALFNDHVSRSDMRVKDLVKQLVEQHRSTAERTPYINDFNAALQPHFVQARTIVDLGGGVYPLQFPFVDNPQLQQYFVVEGQTSSAQVLSVWRHFLGDKIIVIPQNLSPENWGAVWQQLPSEPDLVLLFKFIPVVFRQHQELIPLLAKIPGKRLLITGSSEALVKHQNIRRREERILRDFIELTGRQIRAEFAIHNEFGYLVE